MVSYTEGLPVLGSTVRVNLFILTKRFHPEETWKKMLRSMNLFIDESLTFS